MCILLFFNAINYYCITGIHLSWKRQINVVIIWIFVLMDCNVCYVISVVPEYIYPIPWQCLLKLNKAQQNMHVLNQSHAKIDHSVDFCSTFEALYMRELISPKSNRECHDDVTMFKPGIINLVKVSDDKFRSKSVKAKRFEPKNHFFWFRRLHVKNTSKTFLWMNHKLSVLYQVVRQIQIL